VSVSTDICANQPSPAASFATTSGIPRHLLKNSGEPLFEPNSELFAWYTGSQTSGNVPAFSILKMSRFLRTRESSPDWAWKKERRTDPTSSSDRRTESAPAVIDCTHGPAKSILVVDDDTEITEVFSAILETHGYDVIKVNRGLDGIQAIRDRDFDAVLCDMVMPGLAGDMFYLAVGKLKPHMCERFIFITGQSDNPTVAAFLHRANRRVLYKPIGMDELLETLFQFLHPSQGAAA
jgi:CheY-like chemotaxis protein